jgi:hypothetical protein
MGSKGSTTTTSSAPPQAVSDMYNYLMQQGKSLQQQPYQAYQGTLVPDVNATQQNAVNQSQQYSQAAQPYLQQAGQMTQQAASGYSPQNYAQGVNAYMSPYLNTAMGATAAQMNNVNQQQQQKLLGDTIQQGAFGGDRGQIAQAALMNQQNLALGNVLSGMANQGYQSAAQNYQTGLQQQGALAAQYGNIGNLAQTAGMTGASQLATAGGIPYAVQQAQDAANYQQFAQQQAYPWQTLGSLANMASGLGAGQGGTSATTQPGGNIMSQVLGLGTAFLTSDKRAKDNMEPVGKTFDGQNIYRYNYKGSPTTQLGLSAQEVEKRHPNAVAKNNDGIRMVDYSQATSDAADRGHFAAGGSSQGGLVPNSLNRKPYATYGSVGGSQQQFGPTPYADDPLTQEMAALAKVTLGSYVPHFNVAQGGHGVGIPAPPEPQKQDMADATALGNFGSAFAKSPMGKGLSAYISNNTAMATQPGTWQAPTSDYWGYASGGLVPRVRHADGDSANPPAQNTVPANTDFLGDLGSQVGKFVGNLRSTETQPGLIGNIFNGGKPLDDYTRFAIMAAGLGAAADPSQNPLQAIARGGLTGVQAYSNRLKAAQDYNIKNVENQIAQERVDNELKRIALEGNNQNLLIWGGLMRDYHLEHRPVLDEQGKQKLDPTTGLPMTHSFMAPNEGTGRQPMEIEDFNRALDAIAGASTLSPALIQALRPQRQAQATGGQSLLPEDGGPKIISPIEEKDQNPSNEPPIKMAQAAPVNTAGSTMNDASGYPDIAKGYGPNDYAELARVQFEVMKAAQNAGTKVDYERAEKLYNSYMEKAQKIAKGEEPTLLSDGKTMGFPQSILKANRQKEFENTQNTKNADISGKATEDAVHYIQNVAGSRQILDDMTNLYGKVDTNRLADFQADLIGAVRSLPTLDNYLKDNGLDVDSQDFQGKTDVGQKDTIQSAFKSLGEQASAKAPGAELAGLMKAAADPTRAPLAKYSVVVKAKAMMDQTEERNRAWIQASSRNPSLPYATFLESWTSDPKHSDNAYLQKAIDTTPYFLGMTDESLKALPFQRSDKMPAPSGGMSLVPAKNEGQVRKSWMGSDPFEYDPDNQIYINKANNKKFKINGTAVQ